MPEHIQQMLFDFALERGYIEKLLEMKEEDDKWSTYSVIWRCLSQWSSHYFWEVVSLQ